MARPKKAPDEQRTETARARLTPVEKLAVAEKAKSAGITEAEFLRRRVLGYQVPPARSLTDAALISEINRVGVNVNQLAAATHMDREFVQYWREIGSELQDVLAKVAEKYDP